GLARRADSARNARSVVMSQPTSNGAGPSAAGLSAHAERPPLVPSRIFSGKRFVVVGGTGFLGKVWLSMILHRVPGIAHMVLLVRPKADQTAEERFWAQIATSPVFDPLREKYADYDGGSPGKPGSAPMPPSSGFEAFLRDKITPVAGDVAEPLLGLGDELVA